MTKEINREKKVAGLVAGGGCLSFVAFIGIMIAVSIADNAKKQAAPFNESRAIKVDAQQIYLDFVENEINAKNRYGDKPIILTGTVTQIEGGDPATISFDIASTFDKVKAMVSDEQKAATLRLGDEVELHCVGAERGGGDITVNACNWLGKPAQSS